MEPAVREELVLPSALYAFTFFPFLLSLSFFVLQTETYTVSIKHILKHISLRQRKISILILNHFFYSFFYLQCVQFMFTPEVSTSSCLFSFFVFACIFARPYKYIYSKQPLRLMIHVKAADKERIEGKSFPFWNGISVR